MGVICICIKNFAYQNSTYLKNVRYGIMEYDEIFYVSIISENATWPAFPIDYRYRKNFISEKQLRKLKLEKIKKYEFEM